MIALLVIYILVALVTLSFIVIYFPRAWWTHPTGISIMATKLAIFLVASAQVAHLLTGMAGFDSVIYLGSAGVFLFFVMFLRVILLRKALIPPAPLDDHFEVDLPPIPDDGPSALDPLHESEKDLL